MMRIRSSRVRARQRRVASVNAVVLVSVLFGILLLVYWLDGLGLLDAPVHYTTR